MVNGISVTSVSSDYLSFHRMSRPASRTVFPIKYLRLGAWSVMAFFALLLFAITIPYFSFRPDINFLLAKGDLPKDLIWRSFFYIHISGGMLALIIGPFQLLSVSRKKFRKAHRTLGKIYVAAILLIAAPGGFYMAFLANGGPIAALGFATLAIFWFHTTIMAYRSARARDFTAHREWMYRSYALTFAAVTLRLWVPFASLALGMEHTLVIVLSAWVSWMINWGVVESVIRLKIRRKGTVSRMHDASVTNLVTAE
jgi:uncharacterized membrane protein